jgi:O-antigen/teichoic acid export membrane protein
MLENLARDTIMYTIPSLLTRGLGLILVPLYTRVLSPADYGSFDLLTAFAGIVNLTIALEISQGLARFYSETSDQDLRIMYASTTLWFTLGCYTSFALIMLLGTGVFSTSVMGQEGLLAAYQIGIVYLWISGLLYLVQNQLKWELRSTAYAMVSLTMSVVTLVCSFAFLVVLKMGLEGLLLAMATGSFVATFTGLFLLRRSFRFVFDTVVLRRMLLFSTPLVLSGIAVWGSLYLDRLLINHFLTISDVGLYGSGYRVASISGLIIVGFQGALTPLVYANYKKSETPSHLAQIFRLFVIGAISIWMVLTLFCDELLRVLTSTAYAGGASVVVALVPAILLGNMYIFAPGIGIAKKNSILVWINIIGGLLNAGLNILFIPHLGIVGASIATLISYAAVFTLLMTFSQRLYRVPHEWRPIIYGVVFAVAITFGSQSLRIVFGAYAVTNCTAILLFLLASWYLGLVRRTDIASMFAMLRRNHR